MKFPHPVPALDRLRVTEVEIPDNTEEKIPASRLLLKWR